MKIVLTGGGSGGHFYPVIAIAEGINKIIDAEKIVDAKLYYFSNEPYDKTMLYENGMRYEHVPAGKMRIYFSVLNFFSAIQMGIGILTAIWKLYKVYPDVVVGKGGFASFPTLFAARLLRIPVVIHESDTVPGRVSKWAGKFATAIALSYADAAEYFPKDKVALTGQPVRANVVHAATEGAHEYLKLDTGVPVILMEGGSQGAEIMNNALLDALTQLVVNYEVIHQTGTKNFKEVTETADVILEKSEHKDHYKPFAFLNDLGTKMSAGASSIIISRAGSFIFEIASWGVPSIIIPITKSNGDHQRKNAYAYARTGACTVIEESNLTPTVLATTINDLIKDEAKRAAMKKAAQAFYKPDAAKEIAQEVVNIALSHEK